MSIFLCYFFFSDCQLDFVIQNYLKEGGGEEEGIYVYSVIDIVLVEGVRGK